MQNTGAILCVRGGKKQKYGAGSGLAPRALVLIRVFCQNTRNRPLCSYGFGRALLRVEPDFAPVAVRVRGDGVIVEVGEIVLIHGAGSGLAPRAVVLIRVFCQNTRNRPLCSRLGAYWGVLSEHKEPSPVFTERPAAKPRTKWTSEGKDLLVAIL